jgi:hypothetical protein
MKVGTLKLDFLMRVKQLDIGNRTYTLKNQPELPAGEYEVHVNGPDVMFVKMADGLGYLLERSEHQ